MSKKFRLVIFLLLFVKLVLVNSQNSVDYGAVSSIANNADSLFNIVEHVIAEKEAFKISTDSVSDNKALDYTTIELIDALVNANNSLITNTIDFNKQLNYNVNKQSKSYAIFQNISANSIAILKTNSSLLQKEKDNESIDILLLFNQVKDNAKLSEIGLKMAIDIFNEQDNALSLFSAPVNIEKVSNNYNCNPDQTLFLVADSNRSDGESPKTEKVVKGYSPFSEVYKEFVVFTDSVSKKGDKQTIIDSSSATKSTIKETTGLKSTSDVVKHMNKDSLFETAYRNELFPYELINRFNKESLKKYWTEYQIQKEQVKPVVINNPKDTTTAVAKGTLNTIQKDVEVIDQNITTTKHESQQISIYTDSITKTVNVDEELAVKTDLSDTDKKTLFTGNVVYCVQIAASRTPLSDLFIQTIHNSNEPIKIKMEEDWYKYQYGFTTNYRLAKENLKQTNAQGAFIAAYIDNKKQVLWKTLLSNSTLPLHQSSKLLTFVVQISANQTKLSSEQFSLLQQKHGGYIREIEEEGWYKYQIVIGSNYNGAIEKWKEIGANVSFIVPYYNNKKITMFEAKNIK